MSLCLRCGQPCETTAEWCEACQALSHDRPWEEASSVPDVSAAAHDKPAQRYTAPRAVVGAAQQEEPPQLEMAAHAQALDQTFQLLREAAQHLAAGERKPRRYPHASRLAPLHDISADIRRRSTPLPRITGISERGLSGRSSDLTDHVTQSQGAVIDEGEGESESDIWSNTTDPLIRRHLPNSAEVARIEEEDVRRANAEGLETAPILSKLTPRRRKIRTVFAIFLVLAAAFVVVDSALLFAVFAHPQRNGAALSGPPSLSLSANEATTGQTLTLHIRHFSAGTRVYLSHDIQERVIIIKGSAMVAVDANGSADVQMLVDASWEPGFHTVEAEDVATRYTASATLQVAGTGPTRPAHLWLDITALQFGVGLQGANTLRTMTLHNSGGGSISWSASSNQPWLMLSPPQGIFSAKQTITLAVERANLKPGVYKGTIAFSSNLGASIFVQAQMSVRPLPAGVGPFLEMTPPVLSFTAQDGGANPAVQALTISNPGTRPLNWSLSSNNQVNLASMDLALNWLDPHQGWLHLDQSSGVVVPHGTSLLHALVDSRSLLPGVYTDMLTFSAGKSVIDSPQQVSVSLTIEPHCGLTSNVGSIFFTAVAGQSNPSNQAISLGTTSSCTGATSWKAVSLASWLTATPASGQFKGSATSVTAIGVDASILRPGTYISMLDFVLAQSTQTVSVQLTVQKPAAASAPIMAATPLELNFSTTQGMPNPPGQVITITNTGRSALNWHNAVTTTASAWLGTSPTRGSIPAGQTEQVTINIKTAALSPNTYMGQVNLNGSDSNGKSAAGSPQAISVNLQVLPPCTLQKPSLSSMAFSATQGSAGPGPQAVVITAFGNCSWPLSWHAAVAGAKPWLSLSAGTGTFSASGQAVSLQVTASITGLTAGTYTAEVKISAGDSSNAEVTGTPQVFSVTLSVLPPCILQMSGTPSVHFSAAQGQASSATQSISFGTTGNCAVPTSWSASGDAGSSGWLVLAPTSGSGNGTITASANSQNLGPGTYSGTITLTALGGGGAVVQGSPQSIQATLIVSGYTLSGTALACADAACTTSQPLPNASLSLVNSASQQQTITADAAGNYSFSNLALGTYTLDVSGSIGTTSYVGNATLKLTGDQASYSISAYP